MVACEVCFKQTDKLKVGKNRGTAGESYWEDGVGVHDKRQVQVYCPPHAISPPPLVSPPVSILPLDILHSSTGFGVS